MTLKLTNTFAAALLLLLLGLALMPVTGQGTNQKSFGLMIPKTGDQTRHNLLLPECVVLSVFTLSASNHR
jgi:hypothetical protein